MAIGQKIIPLKGIDLDNAESYIEDMKALFIKNISFHTNDNDRTPTDQGANQFVFTGLESNSQYCNLELPEGANYCVGFYYSKEVREAYVFVWNSINQHLIYRLKLATGECQKVIQSPCLNFKLDPKHMIAEGRCVVKVQYYFNKKTGKTERRIILIYTDDFNDQRCLFVEDVIATNFFDPTLFPYFDINDEECFRCNYINLGVPTPLDCITITPIARDTEDEEEMNKVNKLVKNAWQFRIKYEDVWGRPSEHGVISDMYIPGIGNACIGSSLSQPRCLKLKFKAGCPIVDKIHVEFRSWTGNTRGFSVSSDWYRAEIINKYNDCEEKDWWERDINPDITYNAEDNTIEYTFCADKEKVPIDVAETNRGENPLPLTSSTVFSLGKGIALGRNKRKFEPMDCAELDKIEFGVTQPTGTNCNADLVDFTIYGLIWNPYHDTAVRFRWDAGHIVFGVADCSNNNPFAYDQVLADGQEGIIGCLRGTKHYCVSEQCRYDRQTGNIDVVGMNWNDLGQPTRYIPIQRWKFKVLPGNYIFQISSHKSKPDENYQSKSTYTIGRTSITSPGGITSNSKEIVINGCSGDVEILSEPMMIYDLTRKGKGCSVGDASSVVDGYMLEDEVGKKPIELARVEANISGAITCGTTDHNGFYFCSTRQRSLRAKIYGYKNCVANSFLDQSEQTRDNASEWRKFNILHAYTGETEYPEGDRMLIKGKLVDCNDNTMRISGALVVCSRGGYAITNGSGEYTIPIHDIGAGGVRSDVLYFSQQGSCQVIACAGSCNFCLPTQNITSTACTGSERILNMADVGVRLVGANKKGPKMGGRYGLGIVLHDWMGRKTFVQARPQHYVDIPTLQQTQVFDFSKITFNLNGCVFPAWVRRVSFYITENLNYEEWFIWVAERVQYIDNTGQTNNSAPTQIRFYYESLNEYNKQNNFSTNSLWQFIDDKSNNILGDYIELLANGDGTIYTDRKTALVKHDKQGKYFLIDYESSFADIEDGALVQFVRPSTSQRDDFYYELCPVIRVADQVAVTETGIFNFFDSYLQSRQIPVPVEVERVNPETGELETTTEVQLRNFPFFFEHHSPSDFWGDHAWNKGRVSTKNPYEREQLKRMEVAVSKVLDSDGAINLLHYFTEEDVTEFDQQEHGGIVVGLPDNNTILFICETNNFVVVFNDDAVRIDEEGRAVANSASNRFGKPIRKIGNDFGCHLDDINTIRRRNGIVMWLDTNKFALVQHNYDQGVDVSEEGFKSWIAAKIKNVKENNLNPENGKRFFHGVIDPKIFSYLLTDSVIEVIPGEISDDNSKFVNSELEPNVEKHETICYSIRDKCLTQFMSPTPEYWGAMESDIHGQQLIAFRMGAAWLHHKLLNPGSTVNTFFGVECQKAIEIVFNLDNTKVKSFLWNEVYCKEVQFYCDRIKTESGQQSRLMPRWWEKRDKFWTGDFKCATNTIQDNMMIENTTTRALLEGDHLYGRWMRARYVGLQAEKNKYFELTAIIGFVAPLEKSSTK